MILDERNVPEKVAESEESRDPRQSSDQIITNKPFVRHLTNACHKRCKRANDWDKPRNRNRLAAVLGKKYLRLLNIFHLDKSDFSSGLLLENFQHNDHEKPISLLLVEILSQEAP